MDKKIYGKMSEEKKMETFNSLKVKKGWDDDDINFIFFFQMDKPSIFREEADNVKISVREEYPMYFYWTQK